MRAVNLAQFKKIFSNRFLVWQWGVVVFFLFIFIIISINIFSLSRLGSEVTEGIGRINFVSKQIKESSLKNVLLQLQTKESNFEKAFSGAVNIEDPFPVSTSSGKEEKTP